MSLKSDTAYKSIGEVAEILDLVNKKKGTFNTHTIRFWEKEFKQIKPRILSGNRRYYNKETIELLKKVKYLLKNQGMTINGVKKLLNNNKSLELDELSNNPISVSNFNIKYKLKKILTLVKEIKKLKLNGKKNTRKS
jgi:DNA-binding transcriptional MerR regulator